MNWDGLVGYVVNIDIMNCVIVFCFFENMVKYDFRLVSSCVIDLGMSMDVFNC